MPEVYEIENWWNENEETIEACGLFFVGFCIGFLTKKYLCCC
jgi:hypothetical protein